MGDTGHHPPSLPPPPQRPPWESWLPQCWRLQGVQGVGKRNQLSKSGVSAPRETRGKECTSACEESALGFPWHGVRATAALLPSFHPALASSWAQPLPPSQLQAGGKTLSSRQGKESVQNPRCPQGFCPHLLRALGGSHLIADPAHVVSRDGVRKRRESMELHSMVLEAVCPPWLRQAGNHRWCEPKANSHRHTALAPRALLPHVSRSPTPCCCRGPGAGASPRWEPGAAPAWSPPGKGGLGAPPAPRAAHLLLQVRAPSPPGFALC